MYEDVLAAFGKMDLSVAHKRSCIHVLGHTSLLHHYCNCSNR